MAMNMYNMYNQSQFNPYQQDMLGQQRNPMMTQYYGGQDTFNQPQPGYFPPQNYIAQAPHNYNQVPQARYNFDQTSQFDHLQNFNKDAENPASKFNQFNGNGMGYNQSMKQISHDNVVKQKQQQQQQQQILQQQQLQRSSSGKEAQVVAEDVMSNGLPILIKRDESFQYMNGSSRGVGSSKDAPMWSFNQDLGVTANSLQKKIQDNQTEKAPKPQIKAPQQSLQQSPQQQLQQQPQGMNFNGKQQQSQAPQGNQNPMFSPNLSYNSNIQNSTMGPHNQNLQRGRKTPQAGHQGATPVPPGFPPNNSVQRSPAVGPRNTQPMTPNQFNYGPQQQQNNNFGGMDLANMQSLNTFQKGGLAQMDSIAGSQQMVQGGAMQGTSPKSIPWTAQQLVQQYEKVRERISQMPPEEKSQVEFKQKFLVILSHCSACQDQTCKEHNGLCHTWRDSIRHFVTCKDVNCSYKYCAMARNLMTHFRMCKDEMCLTCVPVRYRILRLRRSTNQQRTENQNLGAVKQQPAKSNSQANSVLAKGQSEKGNVKNLLPLKNAPSITQNGEVKKESPKVVEKSHPDEPDAKRLKKEKDGEQYNLGTSIIEAFSQEQIQQHIESTQNCFLNQKQKDKDLQGVVLNPEDVCSICKQYNLLFEPPSIWCSICSRRILKGQIFYVHQMEIGEYKPHFCHTCYQDQKGAIIQHENLQIKKSELVKEKNEKEIDEPWVQCDTCEKWVHQLCGLFNKGKNNQESSYQCPECLRDGLIKGTREPMKKRPQAMLETKDLPPTYVSDWLEKRVYDKLQKERESRAQGEEKDIDDVPTAKDLTIRCVNNVVKKAEVKSKFKEAFKNDSYPDDFPYRQRVIILTQKIEGVDVVLFVMYVQEYGEECPYPNKKSVYLSYLDSVKYFRPEIAVHGKGQALRTMVYYEMILGYLDYIKQQGFQSMFIWACPPLQGDDYILYCHPQKQKTPTSNRLREWYHQVLQEAKAQNLVTHVTTLFDLYFDKGKDHRVDKVTAMALPYYDGDYWPGEAEIQLSEIWQQQQQMQNMEGQVENDTGLDADFETGSKKHQMKSGLRKASKGKRYASEPTSTDNQLMRRLEKTIGDMKEDFMVVHIQEPCSFCRKYINGGHRHALLQDPAKLPPSSKKDSTFEGIQLEGANPTTVPAHFQLCEECYQEEMERNKLSNRSKLPGPLRLEHLEAIPTEKIDFGVEHDHSIDSEFFSTRIQFLSLCQGNHYQFDTIRRAKHSSMMVLYHIHNPQAPAYVSTCNECGQEVDPGGGFRCTACSDYDMCADCYHKGKHPHHRAHIRKQQNAAVDETQVRLSDQQRRERELYLQKSLQVLDHAAKCTDPQCFQKSCKKIKLLWKHASTCETKVPGGCKSCKRMWCLLSLHAKFCNNSTCQVPRCKELKELVRRSNQRQEDQRRAAYHQFTKQRRQQTQQNKADQKAQNKKASKKDNK